MVISRKVKRIAISIAIFAVFILAVVLTVTLSSSKAQEPKLVHHGGAVVANGLECAEIGGAVLREGGSAVDSAIATLFCEGVTCPQSMGLGGGFLAIIYDREKQKTEYVNARETAPAASREDMFVENPQAAVTGGLAVAVPGELKGYWEMHQKYGKLSWERLVKPTIDLCREGHIVTDYLHRVFDRAEAKIRAEPTLREIYIDPKTNETYQQGEKIKRPELARALEVIAREGADALYARNGSLFKNFVKDIQNFGGIVTEEDMLNYETRWETLEAHPFMDGHHIYASPLPGSGPLLTFIFDLLKEYKIDQSAESWHRVVEAFKFAYAERTKLGDPFFVEGIDKILANLTSKEYLAEIRRKINFDITSNDTTYYGANFSQPEDHGTAHVSVIAPNGDAVAITSTVNYILGAAIRSPSTGIILNDEMDDFSIPGHVNAYGIPASPANFVKPGKRPLSSMTPLFVTDKHGNVQFSAGAAGGSKITLSLVNLMLQYFYFGQNLEKSVEARRIYHLLAPMVVQHEQGFNPSVLSGLRGKGHGLEENPIEFGFTAITAITNDDKGVKAVFDPRRGGSTSIVPPF